MAEAATHGIKQQVPAYQAIPLPQTKSWTELLKLVSVRNIFVSSPRNPIDVFAGLRGKWGMKLSGTIIEPGQPAVAFIRDESGNEELYYEGDKIDNWLIKTIHKDEVILENPTGNQMVLKMGGLVSAKTPPPPNLPPPLPGVDITQLLPLKDNEGIIKQLAPLITSLSPEVVHQRIEEVTGIPQQDIPPGTNLPEYIGNLIKISQDGVLVGNNASLAPISFSTAVNPDNTPQKPQNVFNESDKRIYACFASEGNLKGLKNIITRWINLEGGVIIYLGTKPINPNASTNYVYVEKTKGWSKGLYQVELFLTSNLTPVAQGRFEIK